MQKFYSVVSVFILVPILLLIYLNFKTAHVPPRPVQPYSQQQAITDQITAETQRLSNIRNLNLIASWQGDKLIGITVIVEADPSNDTLRKVQSAIHSAVQLAAPHEQDYGIEVRWTDNRVANWSMEFIAWLIGSFGLAKLGKAWDAKISITRDRMVPYKERYKRYMTALARQSTKRLLQRSAAYVEDWVSLSLGRTIWNIKGVCRVVTFSLVLNLYLAFVPLLIHEPYLIEKINRLDTWALLPAVFAAVNVPLDLLVYAAIRTLVRDTKNGARSPIYLLPGAIVLTWFFAGLSTLFGASLSMVFMMPHPFESTVWTKIFFPILGSWYSSSMLHPFVSNSQIQGVNLGYIALGLLPGCILLLVTTFAAVAWKAFSAIFYKITLSFVAFVLNNDKAHFESIGYVASGFLGLVYIIGRSLITTAMESSP
jgi:hypothetical protein